MNFIVKHFNELSTTELYEILKTRFEIFVTEQECIYQDLDDKDQDAIYVFCYNDSGRVAGCLRVFWKDHDETFGIAQIGRVVTLEHGKGIGGRILHEGVRVATEQLKAKKIEKHLNLNIITKCKCRILNLIWTFYALLIQKMIILLNMNVIDWKEKNFRHNLIMKL